MIAGIFTRVDFRRCVDFNALLRQLPTVGRLTYHARAKIRNESERPFAVLRANRMDRPSALATGTALYALLGRTSRQREAGAGWKEDLLRRCRAQRG